MNELRLAKELDMTATDLKSKVRRINLKSILLYQLKQILDELLRVLGGQYQPMQLDIRVGFSSPAQALFFLICAGDSVAVGYRPHVMPRPGYINLINSKNSPN